MKIVADENIVALSDYFADYGEVHVFPGREISASAVRDADALLVRSVTRVDRQLLEGSRVRYVGSATSGLDHVDATWLRSRGIVLCNAAGANARSVVEYVLCALAALRQSGGPRWRECSVGIIGAGHIGGALARLLEALGIAHLIHDPLLDPALFSERRRGLEEVLAQDILTLHTPLTRDGPHPTFYLLDAGRVEALRAGQTLINAARGAVVDNAALLARLRRRDDLYCVLDAWEHEPAIDLALMERVHIATPHIAGYSQDGKRRGTEMIWRGFCETFGLPAVAPGVGADDSLVLEAEKARATTAAGALDACLLAAYDIRADDARMRALRTEPDPAREFDLLRKHYPVRREFGSFTIRGLEGEARRQAEVLGFRTVE